MPRLKRQLVSAAIILVLLLVWRLFPATAPDTVTSLSTSHANTVVTTTVTRVVDGDTIVVASGEKVRYIGVNTPESVDPRKPVECFGKEASAYNKKLVDGKSVQLVGDVGDKDKYGRLLRYVYLADGTFVNLKLVQDGYASVMTVPPNVAHEKDFVQAQSEAREKNSGLWGMCKNY